MNRRYSGLRVSPHWRLASSRSETSRRTCRSIMARPPMRKMATSRARIEPMPRVKGYRMQAMTMSQVTYLPMEWV